MLEQKIERLKNLFEKIDRAIIAYSGGIDSTLVAKIAKDILNDRAFAITAVSPSLLPEELEDAKIMARQIGITHEIVATQEMDNPNYTSNRVDRCYFCKSELHDTISAIAVSRGYAYIVDGVNADDLKDYRPGIQAAKERGVRSPLAEVGITKTEVRQIARQLGLPWWNKPSQPCLSSRFPYGEEITVAKLKRVGRAEIYLRKLGYHNIRVRSDRDTARIELLPEQIEDFVVNTNIKKLVNDFQELGFNFVTLDLEGYRSGKLNRSLDLKVVN